MPKSLLEAMACGLNVVGTDVMGIQEVINDGETGMLCKPDSASIGKAIRTVLDDIDIDERQRISKNARQEVIENYSFDSVLQDELVFFQSLLSE
jgi:glycosyltransferase involved in cell wall biosynthesis